MVSTGLSSDNWKTETHAGKAAGSIIIFECIGKSGLIE